MKIMIDYGSCKGFNTPKRLRVFEISDDEKAMEFLKKFHGWMQAHAGIGVKPGVDSPCIFLHWSDSSKGGTACEQIGGDLEATEALISDFADVLFDVITQPAEYEPTVEEMPLVISGLEQVIKDLTRERDEALAQAKRSAHIASDCALAILESENINKRLREKLTIIDGRQAVGS